MSCTFSATPGWACRYAISTRGSRRAASDGSAATATWPCSALAMPLTASMASRNATCSEAACCMNTSPAAVSRTVRVVRSNRRTPSASSMRSTWVDNADCDRCSCAAACRKLSVRPNTRTVSISRMDRLIFTAPH
ncbi:hypothetical protein L519_2400 [Bordetella bronchiseptica MBORD678]|nr:hypothetical protein AZ15_2658 [Bordetella bronchiseptica A1-7]KDB66524.1 hypothetical protein AZ21_2555 [Bordetella bronchiseptica B20-10725633]KDB77786.1 hypothetical protein L495_2379 [Bordetella bronchiseptica CARE970018BB]KDC41232.1 hypothetical protein L508_2433 [Bordetella bronchiseptica M435/02/3]KDC57112.1 hypothetical protein L511_2424 [Bordetella bronchiseptica MBORD595]KDC65188.1 hypothetical protein L512_2441 [Bordetella bronchiseptica MBORD624]KDC73958.1 hypothetical protein 